MNQSVKNVDTLAECIQGKDVLTETNSIGSVCVESNSLKEISSNDSQPLGNFALLGNWYGYRKFYCSDNSLAQR
jgi:hypothetical protein